jgi:hypothetical protein
MVLRFHLLASRQITDSVARCRYDITQAAEAGDRLRPWRRNLTLPKPMLLEIEIAAAMANKSETYVSLFLTLH